MQWVAKKLNLLEEIRERISVHPGFCFVYFYWKYVESGKYFDWEYKIEKGGGNGYGYGIDKRRGRHDIIELRLTQNLNNTGYLTG